MAVKNTLATKKIPFTVQLQSKGYQNLINTTLRDRNTANRFIAAITSAVSTNPALQDCDAGTIVSAGLLGESLKLSPSPQLGQYYMVPFKDNKNNRTVAQFQLGYKGYIQLAIRSGQYKKLNVLPVKQGELISFNPLDEEIEVQLIENETERENAETIGYYAMFEYVNGFKKAIYWSKEKMFSHAEKYSAGFRAHKGYTFWEKDFDSMACKTMLRQLISKWGIMSIEMEKAITNDMAVLNEKGEAEYVEEAVAEPVAAENENVIDAAVSEVEDFSDILEENE